VLGHLPSIVSARVARLGVRKRVCQCRRRLFLVKRAMCRFPQLQEAVPVLYRFKTILAEFLCPTMQPIAPRPICPSRPQRAGDVSKIYRSSRIPIFSGILINENAQKYIE